MALIVPYTETLDPLRTGTVTHTRIRLPNGTRGHSATVLKHPDAPARMLLVSGKLRPLTPIEAPSDSILIEVTYRVRQGALVKGKYGLVGYSGGRVTDNGISWGLPVRRYNGHWQAMHDQIWRLV